MYKDITHRSLQCVICRNRRFIILKYEYCQYEIKIVMSSVSRHGKLDCLKSIFFFQGKNITDEKMVDRKNLFHGIRKLTSYFGEVLSYTFSHTTMPTLKVM